MTAINSVGAELIEYIKSADSNTDFAANDVNKTKLHLKKTYFDLSES